MTAHVRFRATIRSLTGIELPDHKISMIEQRLRRRVIHWKFDDTDQYLTALLRNELPEEELRMVVDLMTTNTTSFFRESEHFDLLRDRVLPEALSRKGGRMPRIKIWSAASSEGAEAYTIAMVLAEAVREGKRFDWAILGTDISSRMIEKADQGIYLAEQMSTVPADMAQRYIMTGTGGSAAGKARIVPELRRKVQFREMNLMDATYPVDTDVDVIFLRNILIYFDAPTKVAVVKRITRHLAPGGYLFVGHSESMVVREPDLAQIVPTVFQKGLK